MKIPTHIQQAIQAYYAERATTDDVAALEDWFRADEACIRAFVEHGMLEWQILCEHEKQDAAAVLSILREAEEQAEPDFSLLHTPAFESVAAQSDGRSVTFSELCSLIGYFTAKGLRTKAGIIGSIAAVLVIGALLYVLMIGLGGAADSMQFAGNTPPQQNKPTTSTRSTPRGSEPTARSIVATLTAEHAAVWDRRPGQEFFAGQQFSLISGFAEIMTIGGTVAVLEAPVTFHLIESNNALHLEQGKLVAKVPKQAVGFTVYTPTARIVDYGTQFGVDVHPDGATDAAVFVGEVELSEYRDKPDHPMRSVRLTAGWSSSVSAAGRLNDTPEAMTPSEQVRFTKSLDDAASPGYAYRRAVLASQPLVYWGFDEGQRQTKNLTATGQWNGKAIGHIGHDVGLIGSAIKLTGQIESMGGVSSEIPLDLSETEAYTLEAWCWIESPHLGQLMSLSVVDESRENKAAHLSFIEIIGGEELPQFLTDHARTVRFNHRLPVSDHFTAGLNHYTEEPFSTGQWLHIVAVKDADMARLYMNGELVKQGDDAQAVAPDRPVSLYVGVSPAMLVPKAYTNNSNFRPFHGLIDEVAVYDTALSQDTIRHHFLLAQPGSLPD